MKTIPLLALLALLFTVFPASAEFALPVGEDAQTNSTMSLNYHDAPLRHVVDFYAEAASLDLIIPERLWGTVTYRSERRLSFAECIAAIAGIFDEYKIYLIQLPDGRIKIAQLTESEASRMQPPPLPRCEDIAE